MTYDRTDYRVMRSDKLVILALENGVDEEMAIALAERLANKVFIPGGKADYTGHFRANFQGTKTNA